MQPALRKKGNFPYFSSYLADAVASFQARLNCKFECIVPPRKVIELITVELVFLRSVFIGKSLIQRHCRWGTINCQFFLRSNLSIPCCLQSGRTRTELE